MSFKLRVGYILVTAFCVVLTGNACKRSSNAVEKLPSFKVSTEKVGGESREVITMKNGLSLYVSKTDVVVWFAQGSDVVIAFDPENLHPKSVLLEIPPDSGQPAQAVWDLNADGVPDMRKVAGRSANEVFYRGEWYPKEYEGTNIFISVSNRLTRVHFDGRHWAEVPEGSGQQKF